MDVPSPKAFADRMRAIPGVGVVDVEQEHKDADFLLCTMLTALGYGEGVKVYDEMQKWHV